MNNAGIPTPHDRLTIEPGTIADFDAMKHWHYRAGRPAIWTRIIRAVDPEDPFAVPNTPSLAGALVVSRPVLNGGWRTHAWPGRYRTDNKREDARRINRELRCISRVVIDPRWRGVGLARTLVQAYLRSPETPATEAIAVMGHACPFFASAGMTEYQLAPAPADARLLDACEHADIHPTRLHHTVRERASTVFLSSELRRWAGAKKIHARSTETDLEHIAQLATTAICATPVAYAHTVHQ